MSSIAEGSEYYYLSPAFCLKVEEKGDCQIYNFRQSIWETLSSESLKATIIHDGEKVSFQKLVDKINTISKVFTHSKL
ncbi:MAG: hypothetical protein KDK60_04465 [Chlamydiia bacterium]|nr:hypothetical protein [Chlamydiia bacterium]